MRVGIVGGGPGGSALAILLAREGAEVTVFDDGHRPELLVGESLVPAVIPILQRLGIEEETAAFSCLKPGVSFIWSPIDRFSFTFARFAPAVFPYAYKVPRPVPGKAGGCAVLCLGRLGAVPEKGRLGARVRERALCRLRTPGRIIAFSHVARCARFFDVAPQVFSRLNRPT